MTASVPQQPVPAGEGESTVGLLSAATEGFPTSLEHRAALWRRVEEQRAKAHERRSRAAVLTGSLAIMATTVTALVGLAGGGRGIEQAATPDRFERVERSVGGGYTLVVEREGSSLRLDVGPVHAVASASTSSVHGFEPFGVVNLGRGVSITGATQGTSEDGVLAVAAVAVALPEQAGRVVVTGPGGLGDETGVENPVEVLAVVLPAHDPELELTIEVFDRTGSPLARGTILPFSQSPWVCATNPEIAATTSTTDGGDGGAVARDDRWFTAPLPAACP